MRLIRLELFWLKLVPVSAHILIFSSKAHLFWVDILKINIFLSLNFNLVNIFAGVILNWKSWKDRIFLYRRKALWLRLVFKRK